MGINGLLDQQPLLSPCKHHKTRPLEQNDGCALPGMKASSCDDRKSP
jgi:hypothetical protein